MSTHEKKKKNNITLVLIETTKEKKNNPRDSGIVAKKVDGIGLQKKKREKDNLLVDITDIIKTIIVFMIFLIGQICIGTI
jgi:hypothetical protein